MLPRSSRISLWEREKIDDFFKGIEDFVHFRTKENVWTFFMFELQASKKKEENKKKT